MDLTMLPLVWAQAQPQPAAPNPNSMYFLALRRLVLESDLIFSPGDT